MRIAPPAVNHRSVAASIILYCMYSEFFAATEEELSRTVEPYCFLNEQQHTSVNRILTHLFWLCVREINNYMFRHLLTYGSHFWSTLYVTDAVDFSCNFRV